MSDGIAGRIVDQHHIFFDSLEQDQLGGSAGSYTIQLFRPIKKNNQNNDLYIRVATAILPNTYQVINSSNNSFNITFFYGFTAGTMYSCTMPPGSYTAYSFLSTLQAVITSVLPSAQISPAVFSFTYVRALGAMTLSMTCPDSITRYIMFDGSLSSTMLMCLGFNSLPATPQFGQLFDSSGDLLATYSMTSAQQANLNQLTCYYIRSNNVRPVNTMESLITQSDISNILCKVPAFVPFGAYIDFMGGQSFSFKLADTYIDSLEIQLTTNLSNNLISLNGMSWSARFVIEERERVFFPNDQQLTLIKGEDDTTDLQAKKISLMKELMDLKRQLEEEEAPNAQRLQKKS